MPSEYRLPKHAMDKWGKPIAINTAVEMEKASAAEGAYVGKNRPVDERYGTDDYTVDRALRLGCRLEEWDGMYVFLSASNSFLYFLILYSSTPHAIIDQHRRILGILAGHPDDPNWQRNVAGPAATLLEQTRIEGDSMDAWTDKQYDARRGDFLAMTTGVSYGGGQQVLFCPYAHPIPAYCFLPRSPVSSRRRRSARCLWSAAC